MTNWSTNSVKTNFKVGDLIKNANTVTASKNGELSTDSFGDDLVLGINEQKLTATINKLSLIETKESKLFEDLDSCIEDISYFSCDATSTLNKILNDVSNNIPTIKSNTTSYINDLNSVKKGFGVIEYNKVVMMNKAGNMIPKNKRYIEKEK